MHHFTQAEHEFIDQLGFLRLATVQPNGAPHLTVMWYRREGNRILMITPQVSQKIRNLTHDPRASAVIEDPDSPQRYLELRGTIEIIEDDQRARNELLQIATRYIGDAQAQTYVQSLSADQRVLLAFETKTIFNRNAV